MPEQKKDVEGCGCIVLLALGVVLWLGYSCFYAPRQRSAQAPATVTDAPPPEVPGTLNTPEAAVRLVLSELLPRIEPRLDFLQGANIDIYLAKNEFEQIPFPDRKDAVRRIGKTWCDRVEGTYLPSVRIRDIRAGNNLATYSCTTGAVWLKPSGGFFGGGG